MQRLRVTVKRDRTIAGFDQPREAEGMLVAFEVAAAGSIVASRRGREAVIKLVMALLFFAPRLMVQGGQRHFR